MAIPRRTLLKAACCGTLAATTRLWTPAAAFARTDAAAEAAGTVIVVFLRGAFDGLNAVIPWADPAYATLRPTIAIPTDAVIDLDGRFGLHPSLWPLKDLYDDGTLALVHAAGSLDPTRSHFDAQALMERGTDDDVATGWLARHVAAADVTALPLHAVAWGQTAPASLAGDLAALSTPNLSSFQLAADTSLQAATRDALTRLYGPAGGGGVLTGPGRAALGALDLIDRVRTTTSPSTQPYPASTLGRALGEIARTISADVGLTAATVDVGGWDLHADAGTATAGPMQARLADLAQSLRAFHDDLGDTMSRTTVVVMSEFGRRAYENGSGGTDHGSGNVMLVMGRGIAGGHVHGDWLGMDDAHLYRGDIPVLTDYRDVVAEVVTGRHASDVATVFPAHDLAPLGLTRTDRPDHDQPDVPGPNQPDPDGPPAPPDSPPGTDELPPLTRHTRTRRW